MNDLLERMKNKYGDAGNDDKAISVGRENKPADDQQADLCEFKLGATGWRGCASICLLRAYLDEHPELMAQLGKSGGVLTLRFAPPINADDSDRLRHAVEAVELLRDAKDDILRMEASGGMRMRELR